MEEGIRLVPDKDEFPVAKVVPIEGDKDKLVLIDAGKDVTGTGVDTLEFAFEEDGFDGKIAIELDIPEDAMEIGKDGDAIKLVPASVSKGTLGTDGGNDTFELGIGIELAFVTDISVTFGIELGNGVTELKLGIDSIGMLSIVVGVAGIVSGLLMAVMSL